MGGVGLVFWVWKKRLTAQTRRPKASKVRIDFFQGLGNRGSIFSCLSGSPTAIPPVVYLVVKNDELYTK